MQDVSLFPSIKIYYIDMKNISNEKYFEYSSPDQDIKPERKDYNLIYEGQHKRDYRNYFELAETIYHHCQNDFGHKYKDGVRSMMVGDLVEIDGILYIVASVGFKKVEWA